MIHGCGAVQHPCNYIVDIRQTSGQDTRSQCSNNVDREMLNTARSQDTGTAMEADGVTETGADDITSPAVPLENKSKQQGLNKFK